MNWLVNLSGKPGHFKELDLLQEHENFFIKVGFFLPVALEEYCTN